MSRNPYSSQLASAVKRLSKSAAPKAWSPLFEAFEVLAAAGETAAVARVLEMMEKLPPPKMPPSIYAAGAIECFRDAAGLGGASAERIRAQEADVRGALLVNSFHGNPPKTDSFRKKKTDDPWRQIDHWRYAQVLAESRPAQALALLEEYLAEWPPDDSGAGGGQELVLAIDLALRQGKAERAAAFVVAHGHRFADEPFLIQQSLCLPAVSKAIAKGLLRALVGLAPADVTAALKAIEAGVEAALKAAPKVKVPAVQKRRVTAEYSQVHLEPARLTDAEAKQVYFQDKKESARGVSLFPTKAGIATPSETEFVDAEISVGKGEKSGGALSFPLEVRGPLALRNVGSAGDEDPIAIPPGRYDVLARFVPSKPSKAGAKAKLRAFRLVITFRPA